MGNKKENKVETQDILLIALWVSWRKEGNPKKKKKSKPEDLYIYFFTWRSDIHEEAHTNIR